MLSESHISVHSWPEADYAAFDVFMTGNAKAELCVDVLREAFSAAKVVVKPFKRGDELAPAAWGKAAAVSKPAQLKAPRNTRRAAKAA